jgi:hypothetical protein
MAVHDIDVNALGAGLIDLVDQLTEAAEVGGED